MACAISTFGVACPGEGRVIVDLSSASTGIDIRRQRNRGNCRLDQYGGTKELGQTVGCW